MKKYVLGFSKIAVPIVLAALSCIKLFRVSVHIPDIDQNGGLVIADKTYKYSIMQNLLDSNVSFLAAVFIAAAVLSIIFAIFNMTSKANKATIIIGNISLILSIILFAIGLLAAATSFGRF